MAPRWSSGERRICPDWGGSRPRRPRQQRGFAGAVVAYDAKVVPGTDGQVQVGQHALALIAQRYVPADDEFILFHGLPPRRSFRKVL